MEFSIEGFFQRMFDSDIFSLLNSYIMGKLFCFYSQGVKSLVKLPETSKAISESGSYPGRAFQGRKSYRPTRPGPSRRFQTMILTGDIFLFEIFCSRKIHLNLTMDVRNELEGDV